MFSQRSLQKELLDNDIIPENDLYKNLDELHTINKILGGYSISLDAFKYMDLNDNSIIVDIGCGGGNMLNEIFVWVRANHKKPQLVGIDLKKSCIDYAFQQGFHDKGITFIQDDYRAILNHIPKVDIIHACLFTHHLTDPEIIDLIIFAKNIKATLVVNDLERNPVAYYAIKLLTRLFSKSYLVKNDAPLSVLRGFKKREWLAYIQQAGATHFSVKWKWAFRHQVIIYAN